MILKVTVPVLTWHLEYTTFVHVCTHVHVCTYIVEYACMYMYMWCFKWLQLENSVPEPFD